MVDDNWALLPEACKDEGENEQVEWSGRPLQLSWMVPVNPLVGVAVTARVPELPLVTESAPVVEMEKSGEAVTEN